MRQLSNYFNLIYTGIGKYTGIWSLLYSPGVLSGWTHFRKIILIVTLLVSKSLDCNNFKDNLFKNLSDIGNKVHWWCLKTHPALGRPLRLTHSVSRGGCPYIEPRVTIHHGDQIQTDKCAPLYPFRAQITLQYFSDEGDPLHCYLVQRIPAMRCYLSHLRKSWYISYVT